MELSQIRYFLAVYEQKNFSLAAKQCFITQPSLTLAIKKLEKTIGGQLFYRTTKSVSPTPLAKQLHPHFSSMIEKNKVIYDQAKRFLNEEKVPLKIGISQGIGPQRITELLIDLNNQYPKVEFEITFHQKEETLQLLQNETLNIIFSFKEENEDKNYSKITAYKEPYHVIFSEEHHFKHKKTIPLQLLEKENYIDKVNCEMRIKTLDYCKANKITLYPNYRTEKNSWIQTLVEKNMGVSIVPKYSINSKKCLSRELTQPKIERNIYCYIHNNTIKEVANIFKTIVLY